MDKLTLEPADRKRYERVRRKALARNARGEVYGIEPYAGSARDARYSRKDPDASEARKAEAFGDLLHDRHDPWSVLTAEQAAITAGIALSRAKNYIEILKQLRKWPYRSGKWRMEMAETGRIGPFAKHRVSL